MLRVFDLDRDALLGLVHKYGLSLEVLADDQTIDGSFWGEPEAGVIGDRGYVRGDTPVHSLLHEACHVVCMTAERRDRLEGDAGGDDESPT